MAQLLDTKLEVLRHFAFSVERKVQERRRRKSNGEFRIILAPDPALKDLLTRIDRRVLRRVPLQPRLFLRPGSSYIKMIQEHTANRCLITADIDDFFPSVRPSMVHRRLKEEGFGEEAARLLTRLATIRFQLPQGFPTSSTIAAIVLRPVMVRLDGLARKARLAVGVYADNLAISAIFDADKFERLVKRIFRQSGFRLDTFMVMREADRKTIMGIVLANGLRVRESFIGEIQKDLVALVGSRGVVLADEWEERVKTVRGKIGYVREVNYLQAYKLSRFAERVGFRDPALLPQRA